MAEKLPIDSIALTELMQNAIIVNHNHSRYYQSFPFRAFRVRSNIERHKLSNGKWNHSLRKKDESVRHRRNIIGYSSNGGSYYSFLNSKVKLTDLGLYILDSLKAGRPEGKSPGMVADEYSDDSPRHASTIT